MTSIKPFLIGEIRDEVEAIGTTRANESVIIAAKLTDTVSRVNFEDGELVNDGEVLVELTNREQSALLDEAESNLQDARNQARASRPPGSLSVARSSDGLNSSRTVSGTTGTWYRSVSQNASSAPQSRSSETDAPAEATMLSG